MSTESEKDTSEITPRAEQVKTLSDSGKTMAEIAKTLNISRQRVQQIMSKYGFVRVKKSERTKTEVMNLVKQGLSDAEIAEQLGLSKVTVGMYRLDAGGDDFKKIIPESQIRQVLDLRISKLPKYVTYQEISETLNIPLNRVRSILHNHSDEIHRKGSRPRRKKAA